MHREPMLQAGLAVSAAGHGANYAVMFAEVFAGAKVANGKVFSGQAIFKPPSGWLKPPLISAKRRPICP